jgi:hypothetical protein
VEDFLERLTGCFLYYLDFSFVLVQFSSGHGRPPFLLLTYDAIWLNLNLDVEILSFEVGDHVGSLLNNLESWGWTVDIEIDLEVTVIRIAILDQWFEVKYC